MTTPTKLPSLSLRLATDGDVPFLWEMLTYAASMSPGGAASIAEAQADPYLRTYVEAWGRADDLGVIACASACASASASASASACAGSGGGEADDTPHGAPIGAAWVRAGLIVAEPRAPELATAVVPAHRGCGVGGAMMNELFRRAAGRFDGVILSVRANNPALRFYERLGFRRERELTNRVGGVSFVMRRPAGLAEP